MNPARLIRMLLAMVLYELALQVAPADVAADVQAIVADGLDIARARVELAELDCLTAVSGDWTV